jgi:hypothetical protein
MCWSKMGCVTPLCTLVVDARDWGRFRLLFDTAVFERDRDFAGLLSVGG